MKNNEWYVVVDTANNVAIDFRQLPELWKEKLDLQSLSDEQLKTVGEWSTFPNLSFVSIDEARSQNVNNDSIDYAYGVSFSLYADWLRGMRDLVLAQTDNVMLEDRQSKYDVVARRNILAYREGLRNITKETVYGEKWPTIPPELDFIRKVEVPDTLRPSKAFLAHLNTPRPPLSREQIIVDQELRILALREQKRYGGVKLAVDGVEYWFWNDESARTQYALLDSLAQRSGLPDDFVLEDKWKTMTGVFASVTVATMRAIVGAGIAKERTIFTQAEAHREAMKLSDDPANYDFTVNWPACCNDVV